MTDHLGSLVGTLSSTGAMLSTQDVAPFGEIFATTGRSSDAYVFTGKERDVESGNDYFGARFYSSNMGRFMSPDWAAKAEPIPYSRLDDPQTLNLYSYVGNNPTSQTDADGHALQDAIMGVGWVNAFQAPDQQSEQNSNAAQQQQTDPIQVYGTTVTVTATIGAIPLDTAEVGVGVIIAPEALVAVTAFGVATGSDLLYTHYFSQGPKATDAPGVTAGGQATDRFGNKIGPSGRNQVDQVDHAGKKDAKDAARAEGKGTPEKHPSPAKGDPHYHPADENGEKLPISTHHNYPE
jgi:RHS repeat-associated protein